MAFHSSISGRSAHELVEAYVLSRRKAKFLFVQVSTAT